MITQIEKQITTRLQSLVAAARLDVLVDSYGGQLTDEGLRAVSQSAPVFWVVFSGMNRGRRLRDAVEAALSFTIIAASKASDGSSARSGAHGGQVVGAYDLVSLAVAGLDGWVPDVSEGSGVQPLKAGAVRNLFNGYAERDILAIYSLSISGHALLPLPSAGDDAPEDLELIVHSAIPHLSSLLSDAAQTDPVTSSIPQKEASNHE